MRRPLLGLVIILGVSAVSSEARAQVPFTNVNDPIFAYYAFYLPRQQAQALQPGPEATINAFAANRQQYAATNRNGMFDPSGSGIGTLDFGDDFSSSGVRRRGGSSSTASKHAGNLNGLGPAGYFNKANQYYPGLRSGRGKNANVYVARSRGRFSGGGTGLGGGLPGPR